MMVSLWTSNATTDYDGDGCLDSDSWIFAEIINSGSANQVASVATDGEGNTIIAGRYYGTLTLGSHSITNPSTSYSLFIAKFASDGTWDWLKGAGGSSNNAPVTQAESVAINNEGDIFVTGHFTDTISFGTTSLTSPGNYDLFVAKISGDGDWLWATRAGGTSGCYGQEIRVDSSGNAMVTGFYSNSAATFGTTTLSQSGSVDLFVAKINDLGVWQWAIKAGGSSSDYSYSIDLDSTGAGYITGFFSNTVSFGSTSLTSAGMKDVFVAKVSNSGSWEWAVRAGSSDDEEGSDLTYAEGNIYLTGEYKGTPTFGSITLPNPPGSHSNSFVAKMDQNGNWDWVLNTNSIGPILGHQLFIEIQRLLFQGHFLLQPHLAVIL